MLFPTALYKAYKERVRDTAPIAYWPLDELSGSTALDISGNTRNGAYTGVTLVQPGMGDGGGSPLFDGVNDYCNIYSAGLASAFNGSEGSIALWGKVAGSGVWTDATIRRSFRLAVDASNSIHIGRTSTNNQLQWSYISGGAGKTRNKTLSPVDWMHLALTWSASADQVKPYFNGVQEGATLTTLGAWTGSLASTLAVLGATNATPANPWSGSLAHAAIWNRALTAGEVAELYRVN